jgi:excinuclease ABC subunit C
MTDSQHPFFKLTLDEKYPRLLITRRPEKRAENQAIYGAFLPTGMARRMLDLLQRVFRLRPCELDIKGDFESPCPEYFLHRCLAPCVERICQRETYLETIEIVHLILSNQIEIALKKIDEKIERCAEDLEFEKAAEWRDKRELISEISRNAKWQIHAAAMNDVISLNDENEIQITTLRRGKSVGKLHFQIENAPDKQKILAVFIENFYQFYAPKQIFVPFDFPERKSLEEKFNLNFGRKTKIIAHTPERLPPSVSKTNTLAAHNFKYKKGQSIGDVNALAEQLKLILKMRRLPRRIECFDVAHLAGKEIVGSRVVAVDGVLQSDDGLVWEFENLSETAAIAEAVRERIRLLPAKKDMPDLLLIDGAKPQIKAVVKILEEFSLKNLTVIGAVKPPKAHNQISYFLTTQDVRIEFDRRSKAMNFLQNLRDAAHTLANETHRELHSLGQIFKNNDSSPHVQYLLVPTRFAEERREANDLSPIRSLTQAGEIILKSKSGATPK